MATVIPFEERAVAHLRERLGAAVEANEDLIAFARGHSGAVTAIHAAVLAAIEADGIDGLFHVVTQEWPLILGIDAVALSLIVGDGRLPRRWVGRPGGRAGNSAPGHRKGRRRGNAGRGNAVTHCSGQHASSFAPRPSFASIATRPCPSACLRLGSARHRARCAPRVRTADVPWSKSCGYDPQVVDEPPEV